MIDAERIKELKERILKAELWIGERGSDLLNKCDLPFLFDLLAVLDEHSALKAENERLNNEMDGLVLSSDPVRMMRNHLIERAEKAEAELAKQAPLIEATLNPEWPMELYQNNDLTRAALALREEKGK